jgi:hypothetical protein
MTPTNGRKPEMPIADIVTRIKDNILPANAPKLEKRLAESIADRDQKRAALDSLLLADRDGSEVMKAEDALQNSERRVLNLESALNTAKEKAAAESAEDERDAQRAEWKNTVKLAEDRQEAITRMAKSAADFARDYNEVLRINSDLLAHLPMSHDSIAALTDRPTLETTLRRHLVKNDLPWATQWAWGKVSLPDLVPQSEGALSVIRNLAPKELQ